MKPCGTCRRAVERAGNKFFPFCSERCQMADLGRWLREKYRVPDGADGSAGGELPADEPDQGLGPRASGLRRS